MPSIDEARALETLKAFVSRPHPQNDLQQVRGFISEVVTPRIEALPFDEVRLDERGNLIAGLGVNGERAPLVLCSYAGSYPAEDMPDAYTPKIVGGEDYGLEGPCMWGRSTTEQLSAGAALLEAVTAFLETPKEMRRGLLWITNYSGEMGNHEAVDYLFLQQELPFGPTLLAMASDNRISLGNLGRIDVEITLEGISCHSSDPSKGLNAIDGIKELLEKLSCFPHLGEDPDLGAATFTPTLVKTWPEALHTVPAHGKLVLDRRLLPGEKPGEAMREIREYIGTLESGLKISYQDRLNFQYPHKASPECALARAARAACQSVLGQSMIVYQRTALDMGFFSHHGQDSITFGPGDYTLAHSDHEMVPISDYLDAARVYLMILEEMLL
jgi:acetylornithine deacetylase/succinyl-diaminopimelate desuccinylase-like protein